MDETQRKCIDKPTELSAYYIEEQLNRIFETAPTLMKIAMCRLY